MERVAEGGGYLQMGDIAAKSDTTAASSVSKVEDNVVDRSSTSSTSTPEPEHEREREQGATEVEAQEQPQQQKRKGGRKPVSKFS